MKEVGNDLINISLPFRQIGYGENGIYAVVAPAVDGLNVEAVQLKNAQDVSVFYDALCQAHPMIPHIIRFLVEGKSVESCQVHFGIY